jgi:hypothetical protein
VAKRPDLNELDVPERTELALNKVEWRKLATAAHRPLLEMEIQRWTASRRQSATTRVWGSIGSAEIFAERRGHSPHNDKVKVRRAPRWTGQIQAGRGGRLMGLGGHAGEWSDVPSHRSAEPVAWAKPCVPRPGTAAAAGRCCCGNITRYEVPDRID